MKCPYCAAEDSKVLDSRPTDEGTRIRRRRECLACQKRFTTYEVVETVPIIVIKKDKSREIFDREKVLKGMLQACHKRPVPISALERAVDGLEAELSNSMDTEIPSKQIGEMVMARLKEIDEVAYVRFASVYRDFRDIDTFMQELILLLKER
mgnify:CR=1 FL=1|jgi:transcriptional repressor NrdR